MGLTNKLITLSPVYKTTNHPLRQFHPICHVTIYPPPLMILKKSRKRTVVMMSSYNQTHSPSDLSTMFFQAEGTMNEAVIPTVTRALQNMEGISNLNVQIVEGLASVELMKEITQATGAASSLVEIIQGSGFKLHTLNLSFEDHEEVLLV